MDFQRGFHELSVLALKLWVYAEFSGCCEAQDRKFDQDEVDGCQQKNTTLDFLFCSGDILIRNGKFGSETRSRREEERENILPTSSRDWVRGSCFRSSTSSATATAQ